MKVDNVSNGFDVAFDAIDCAVFVFTHSVFCLPPANAAEFFVSLALT